MKLLYFAWVRQMTGKSEEDFVLPAGVTTVRGLADHLATRGGGYAQAFADHAKLRAAVNREHVSFEATVTEHDEVAFFPPVTGG